MWAAERCTGRTFTQIRFSVPTWMAPMSKTSSPQDLGRPNGIALDVGRGKMYWTDSTTDKIKRANLDGSNVEDLITKLESSLWYIALDVGRGKMYWADNGTDKIKACQLGWLQCRRPHHHRIEWSSWHRAGFAVVPSTVAVAVFKMTYPPAPLLTTLRCRLRLCLRGKGRKSL